MLICSSPRLIAACHVLHRLLMPRHSPYALVRLNFLLYDSMIILGSRSLNCLSFSLSSRSAELSFRIILTLLRCEKAIRLLHFVFEFHLSVKLFSLTIWKDSIISYFVLFCSFSYSNLSSIRLSKISAQLFSESDRFAFSVRSPSTHFPSCDVRGSLAYFPDVGRTHRQVSSVVGLDGLEPSTSRLSGARSSHLSYRPLYSRALIRITFAGTAGWWR